LIYSKRWYNNVSQAFAAWVCCWCLSFALLCFFRRTVASGD